MTLSLAMVLMVGLSNLQFVKINSVRNQTVFGLSLLVGMMLPRFMQENPGAINTGEQHAFKTKLSCEILKPLTLVQSDLCKLNHACSPKIIQSTEVFSLVKLRQESLMRY